MSMSDTLKGYQKEAVDKIYEFYESNHTIGRVNIATGVGKNRILVSAVKKILGNCDQAKIVILSSRQMQCEQIKEVFKENGIKVLSSLVEHNNVYVISHYCFFKKEIDFSMFNMIICDDVQELDEKYTEQFEHYNNIKILGILPCRYSSNKYFDNAKCLFEYTWENAIKDGHNSPMIREREFVEGFLSTLINVS